MSKKNKNILLIAIIIVVALIGIGVPLFLNIFNFGLDHGKVMINDQVIKVEIADTPEARMKGLSGKEKIGKNEGMLFVMDELRYHSFWMADMKFPIDIIWIANNEIVDLTRNAQVPVEGQAAPVFRPETEVNRVLEVNAGYIDEHNINIGDQVTIYL